MYIQRSREFTDKANELADTLIAMTEDEHASLHLPARLQKVQLTIQEGKGWDALLENKNTFLQNPTYETLMIYLATLS